MTEPIIQFSLRLRLADTGVRPAGAYLLAGSDVTEWLAEIGRWAMPMASLRLYVLPTSVRDITPAGTLVVLPDEGRPAPSPTAVAYSRFGENFYLPVDCDLFPAVSKSELRERLRGHLYVLHPTIGLVGFEPADAKVVHELLAPPIRKAANWACAHPGIAASPGLRSLTALPPDLDTLMEQARDDIHSEPTDGVPPSPGDSVPGPLGQAGLTIAQGLLGALSGLGKAFGKLFGSARGGGAGGGKQSGGKSAGGPGWLSRMMAGISERLQAARNREIARLMNLLKTNPDEGLRYALPFGGAAHRGLAKPGDRLTRRDVNFNLHGLGGGTPADVWEMPDDYRRHLANMYRQSAQREVGLGRYRRAAYIYAELLGDYHAAANVLVQGRHYREAAVLYKEHLHIPREAARCLEKGGLLAEAIVIYLELGEFETAGDLHTKLGNANAASAAYREAVTKYRDANDLLRAAGVLDEKLKSPDEAVDLLWSGWPDDLRAAECLGRRFALLGRLGRHDRVGRDVQLLRDQAYSTAHSRLLIDALVRLNQTYPDATLRTCSADAVRVVAGPHPACRRARRPRPGYQRRSVAPPPGPPAPAGCQSILLDSAVAAAAACPSQAAGWQCGAVVGPEDHGHPLVPSARRGQLDHLCRRGWVALCRRFHRGWPEARTAVSRLARDPSGNDMELARGLALAALRCGCAESAAHHPDRCRGPSPTRGKGGQGHAEPDCRDAGLPPQYAGHCSL